MSMHIANHQRIDCIKGLAIRDPLKQFLICQLEIGPFEDYFRDPSQFYSQGHPDNPGNWRTFASRRLLPLWQHGDRIYALDINASPAQVISWYIESPDAYQVAPSLDAAIFDMIYLHVWEYGGGEEEAAEAMRFAEQIALPNATQLSMLLADIEGCTEEMILGYRQSL